MSDRVEPETGERPRWESTAPSDPRLVQPDRADTATAPFDPLRLCVFATVALLGWVLGPVALVVFAAIGFSGYWQARRAGLLRSRCKLGDTRLVLVYLYVLIVVGVLGVVRGWFAWA